VKTKTRHPPKNLPNHPTQIAILKSGSFRSKATEESFRGFCTLPGHTWPPLIGMSQLFAPGMKQNRVTKPNGMKFLQLSPLFGHF
jgi:hypothetical protein